MTAATWRRVLPLKRPRLVRGLEHGQHAELVDHLGELRVRLFIVMGAVLIGFVGAFVVHEQIIGVLNQSLPEGSEQPITLGIAEPFLTSIKVSLWAAFALAMPVILWQGWGFVAPALDSTRRRTTLAFVTAGSLLFAGGAAFSYLIALPSAVAFLTSYDAELYNVQVRAKDYYTFAVAVIVSVGMVFELPIVLLGLIRVRILSVRQLKSQRRIAYVGLTALAVLLPGVDPVLTVMELVPLALLYELTIVVGSLLDRRWQKRDLAAEVAVPAPPA